MPVFSFSSASIFASMSFPPDCTARSRSTSAFAPARIMPPSRTSSGGSSTMVAEMRSVRSSSGSSCSCSTASSEASISPSSFRISGSACAPCASEARSRQEHAPVAMRVMARSKSVTSRRLSESSSRSMVFRVSSSTAESRFVICAGESRGRSIQLRSRRPPMAVRVWSSTQSRLPRFSFERMVCVSSRLRRAARSSPMNRPAI